MVMLMLLDVIQPPSGDSALLLVAFCRFLPFTIHLMSAGGFELAVLHERCTVSPTLPSVGPEIVT
jgi:hypothetical protein